MVGHMINEKARTFLMGSLNKEKLNQKIVARIKKLIFSNELRVGDKLPSERELMEKIGVSRTVVRESLRSLEQAGLVEIKQGGSGGAFVVSNLQKPIFNSALDLYSQGKLTLAQFVETRKAIECVAVRVAAAKATSKDIAWLRELNEACLPDIEDKVKHREHSARFHTAVAEISGNHLSELFVSALFELLGELWPDSIQTMRFKQESYTLHKGIIEALAAKNADLCERIMVKDIERTGTLDASRIKAGRTKSRLKK
jgi:GntR family transcriptional regulator, transcriptional repressor for pyruvate dehydrogenase complex